MTPEQQRKLEMLKKLWKEYEDGENVGEKWASYEATFAATFDTLLQIIQQQQAVIEAARAINDIVIYLPIAPGHPDYEKFEALEEAISQLDT